MPFTPILFVALHPPSLAYNLVSLCLVVSPPLEIFAIPLKLFISLALSASVATKLNKNVLFPDSIIETESAMSNVTFPITGSEFLMVKLTVTFTVELHNPPTSLTLTLKLQLSNFVVFKLPKTTLIYSGSEQLPSNWNWLKLFLKVVK